jgi:hypothetical protein
MLMELILSSIVLTFLLLVGSFVDFLVTSWSRQSTYHGDAFSAEPKSSHVLEFTPDRVAEYDRAA